jgi:hypothetical protein
MIQWQYARLTVETESRSHCVTQTMTWEQPGTESQDWSQDKTVFTALNRAGMNGWELVTSEGEGGVAAPQIPDGDARQSWSCYIFKRLS